MTSKMTPEIRHLYVLTNEMTDETSLLLSTIEITTRFQHMVTLIAQGKGDIDCLVNEMADMEHMMAQLRVYLEDYGSGDLLDHLVEARQNMLKDYFQGFNKSQSEV